ncbi:hypothetical protein [Halobacillus ihumii]|uniref:hypothetical protein n=1 Tax=Halobacillus ihumii TaxID=2686092 RepID=UPI0013D463AF|nr:hypothetical protein [Halobacillus ihumii]
MKSLLTVVVVCFLVIVGCAEGEVKQAEEVSGEPEFNLEGFKMIPEYSFSHNGNGFTVTMKLVNNTGKDIKVFEGDPVTGGLQGFTLSEDNSNILNGEVLESGETKINERLMYYYNGLDSQLVKWIKPTFTIKVEDKTYKVKGKKMYNVLPAMAQ